MKQSIFIAMLVLIVAGMVGTVAAATCECPSALPAGLEPVTDLMAGQTEDVGDIYVWNDADCLYIWYDVTADDWYLTETHLDVQCDKSLIPQTPLDPKKGGPNPIPGQFAYGDEFEIADAKTSWCQAIDKPACANGNCEEGLAIAAHAVVQHVAEEECIDIFSDTTIGVDPTYKPWDAMGLSYPDDYTFPSDAKWIWKTALVSDPVNGEIVEFSKTFNIPGIAIIEKSGEMYVTCDNGYELNVNGELIGRAQLADNFRTSYYPDTTTPKLTNDIVWWYDNGNPVCDRTPYGWQTVEKYDITNKLNLGANTLQLTGVNEANIPTECPLTTGTCERNPAGCKFSTGDGICYTVVDQKETAWDDGTRFTEKGSWGMWFGYDWSCVCDETVLYATQNYPTDPTTTPVNVNIYSIDPATGSTNLVRTQSLAIDTSYTNNFNGNAFDEANNRFYFADFRRLRSDPYTGRPDNPLYFYDVSSGPAGAVTPAGTLTGAASDGAFYDGRYYYIAERTDDLYEVSFAPDGTKASENKIKELFPGTTHVLAFGDIAIRDGVLYVSATDCPTGPSSCSAAIFFKYDLASNTYTLIKSGALYGAGGTQIAFGADGILYGVNARTPYEVFTINPADGAASNVHPVTVAFSDLASGACTHYS